MHSYSTDSDERRFVPLILAALAIVLAWGSSQFLAAVHVSLPWWMEAPSTLGLYGSLYTLFDKHLWKTSSARKLGLSKVPNLEGRWKGFLVTSFDDFDKQRDVMLQIFQSWTQISIYVTTATSISRSCVAVIQVSDLNGAGLVYQYQCQPLANARKSMHMHYGTGMLRMFKDDTSHLIGEYYAGRDRGTFGQICFWKVTPTGKAEEPTD
ncbi:MAG: hypothetical protein DMG40_13230 [Acidobacteria bacterium]|nr:MAG: hypothetical protein DMG40_13230 [Acidobacteriota bacterium]